MKNRPTASFDNAAADYDQVFTHSLIGKMQRERVYYFLEKIGLFRQAKRIFEINCGTGYDAEQLHFKGHHLVATDASEEMINIARSSRADTINFYSLKFEELSADKNFCQSEVLFSNFGGLNCMSTESLKSFLAEVASKQQSSNLFIAVIMGRHCFMEDLYHFIKLKWKQIGRRNTSKPIMVNVNDTRVPTFYHSPKEVVNALENYHLHLLQPIALLLPPSYMEPFFRKYPRILSILNNLEKVVGQFSFLSSWADHYIIVAEKK